MIKKEVIRKIAEQIEQNSGKTSSTGLYNGKAGLSISLFIAAEYLLNEQLEDIAYRLLQESLIIKSNDVSFENGLAGIGYTLLYLIENKYLEADFDEIFGSQYETIIKNFENIEKEPSRLINSLQIIYFLSRVCRIKKEDNRIQEIIKKFFEGLELFLTVQFQDFADIRYIGKKLGILNIFKTYLKLVDYSGYNYFSRSLLENYSGLYRNGRVISSLGAGFYLSKIVSNYNIKECEDVVNENISSGLKNIFPKTLSLKERIDMSKIINNLDSKNVKEFDLLPELKNIHIDIVIRNLLMAIDGEFFPFGYGAGLSRLLIYCVNKQTELL